MEAINTGWHEKFNMRLRSYPESYEQLIARRTRSAMKIKIRNAVLENLALGDRTKQTLLRCLPIILSAIRGIFLETFMRSHEPFFIRSLHY
jgi:hypothetical protein